MTGPSTPSDYGKQFISVLNEVANNNPHLIPAIKRSNIEFMARGEPLANPHVLKNWFAIHREMSGSDVRLREQFRWYPAAEHVKYHISTILPDSFVNHSLADCFLLPDSARESWPTIYYSAWSINPAFKARWMPRAMPTPQAISKLAEYQRAIKSRTGGDTRFANTKVIIHGAFVHGQNDSLSDLQRLVQVMNSEGLVARFNVIRYNPPKVGPFSQFAEASDQQRRLIVDWLTRNNSVGGVKEIDRVGLDVYASCGTFVPKPTASADSATSVTATAATATGACISATTTVAAQH